MSDFSMFIWLITFGITVVGSIPYGIWMVLTALRKQWRKLGLQVVAPMVIFGLLFITTRFIDYVSYKIYLKNIYDVYVDYGVSLFEYHSERDFTGDGYSIAVYKLPDSIRRRFQQLDESLLNQFPKRPSYRNHWSEEHWREAPFDRVFEKHLSFALSAYDAEKEASLNHHFQQIRIAMNRKGTFYSFFKCEHRSSVGDIDMFIVDLEDDRLYVINHNT